MLRGNRTDFRPIGVCVAYEEALGEGFNPEMLREVTAALPRANAAGYLSALGAALDSPHWRGRQADLAYRFLLPPLVAERVERLITRGDRDFWVHPGMVVAGWRALALWGNADAQASGDLPRLSTKWLFLLSDAYLEAQTHVFERAGCVC